MTKQPVDMPEITIKEETWYLYQELQSWTEEMNRPGAGSGYFFNYCRGRAEGIATCLRTLGLNPDKEGELLP